MITELGMSSTYSGYENRVKTDLEKRVESMGMEDKIFQVVVPTEEVVEYKDGKRKITERKIFPVTSWSK